jgi:hypothetical protein
VEGLHTTSGTCDLCGEACDANTQELNVLSCTFKNCEDLPYHQDCLEKVRVVVWGKAAGQRVRHGGWLAAQGSGAGALTRTALAAGVCP